MRHTLEIHHVRHISSGEDEGEKDQGDDSSDCGGHVDIAVMEGVREIFHYG